MSAVDAAAAMSEPLEHYDRFAELELAAVEGFDAGSALARLSMDAKAETGRLVAERPDAPLPARPASRLHGLGGFLVDAVHHPVDVEREIARESALDAVERWERAVDDHEAAWLDAVERWRRAADPAWLERALRDRDDAMRQLAGRGLIDAPTLDATIGEPFGALVLHSALAHD